MAESSEKNNFKLPVFYMFKASILFRQVFLNGSKKEKHLLCIV